MKFTTELFPDFNTETLMFFIINQYKSEKIILETFIISTFSYDKFSTFKSNCNLMNPDLVVIPQY